MLQNRVIPTLLLDGGRLVKTVKFKKPIYIGDPINAVKIFNDKEVDELCLLDIKATTEGKNIDFKLLESITREAFMPVCYGGGVKSLNAIDNLFSLGIEKVALNTMLFKNKELIEEAVAKYGSQSIVGSVDVKKNIFGKYNFKTHAGSKNVGLDINSAMSYLNQVGVGELYLTSIDKEGTMTGFDMELISLVSNQTNLPIIVNGGASNCDDIAKVFSDTSVTAVSCGSLFVYQGRHRAVLINYPSSKIFNVLGEYKNV